MFDLFGKAKKETKEKKEQKRQRRQARARAAMRKKGLREEDQGGQVGPDDRQDRRRR